MPTPDPHAPFTIRFRWAACAADPRSPLTRTERAAIVMALADPAWVPTAETLPGTWAAVERWCAPLEERRG